MFSKEIYTSRRKKLADTVSSGLILLPGNEESPMNYADNTYHFRQDSTFLYYFGIDQASLAGIIDADSGESVLFGDDYSIDMIVWTGKVPSIAELGEQVGVTNTKPFSSLQSTVSEALSQNRKVHFLNPYRADINYSEYNPPWERPGQGRQRWVEQDRKIQFINVPNPCEIKIYTLAGDLVQTIQHSDPERGFANWNLTSAVGQTVASGIFLFSVEDTKNGNIQVGKFVVIK